MSTVPMIFPTDSPRARRSDPLTSHNAADMTRGRAAHAEVLSWLSLHPTGLTDDEIHEKHVRSVRASQDKRQFSATRLRTVRSELVREKTVAAVPLVTGSSSLGNPAQVWRLA